MAEFLNKNIKYLRFNKGLSQQSLADKIGVDRSTISRIENDEIETTVDNAIKIAEILNVSLSDLVCKDLSKLAENTIHKSKVIYNDENIAIQYENKSGEPISNDKKAEIISEVYKFINEEDR